MRTIAPERMTHADILAEVGELLATGIQRFLARECDIQASANNPADSLAEAGLVEAPCAATPELTP